MIPVYSFIAYSNTGKTTYIEKLIAELTRRGVRVGAVKHDSHDFTVDREGKDSWRFAHAGAQVVAIASASKCAVMEYRPVDMAGVIRRISDVDIILVEGWHAQSEQCIALYRSDSGSGLKLAAEDCVAVVSDTALDVGDTPLFPLDDVRPMADFLQEKIKAKD